MTQKFQKPFEYEMRKGGRSVLRWLLRERLTRSQWKRIGLSTFTEPSRYEEFIEEIDEFYDALDRGNVTSYHEKVESLKNQIYFQLNKKIQKADFFSQIVALELDPEEDADDYWMVSPEIFMDFRGPPSYSVITAPKGTGKTSTMSKIGQMFAETGEYFVVGNIPMKGNVKGYTQTIRMSDALLEACKNVREGMNTLLLWDEATLSLMKAQATRKESITFEKIDTLLRKLGIDIQISYVLEKDVHTRLELQWNQWIRKLSKKMLTIEQGGGKHQKTFFKVIKGWPDAEWPYDSQNWDVLEIDFDVDKLLKAIGTSDTMDEKLGIIEDWLRNVKKSPYLEKVSRQQKAVLAYKLSRIPMQKVRKTRNLTQTEIARILGCSQPTVNNMIEEIRNELEGNPQLRQELGEVA